MQTLSYTGSDTDNPHVVIVHARDDGDDVDVFATPLAQRYVRHSPDGFSWGYGGSGPSDLALNMLAHALGPASVCSLCGGEGKLNFADTGPTCVACEGTGLAQVVLRNYQDFKWAYVANFVDDWSITRTEIVEWAAAHEGRRVQREVLHNAELSVSV